MSKILLALSLLAVVTLSDCSEPIKGPAFAKGCADKLEQLLRDENTGPKHQIIRLDAYTVRTIHEYPAGSFTTNDLSYSYRL